MGIEEPFTEDDLEVLRKLLKEDRHDVCPNCGKQYLDPLSEYGWCVRCTNRRERQLEAKRKWWRNNRGAEDFESWD